MSRLEETKTTGAVVHHDDVAEANKLGIAVDEVVANRITEEDLMRISAESLHFRSKTGFRIVLIMIVMGFNQAGYGVDWGVIGGIVGLFWCLSSFWSSFSPLKAMFRVWGERGLPQNRLLLPRHDLEGVALLFFCS